jgi:hypothetical protein
MRSGRCEFLDGIPSLRAACVVKCRFTERSETEFTWLERMIDEVRRPEPFLDPTLGRRSTTAIGLPARSAPQCPVCGGAMVERVARRGAKAGSRFLGCESFPGCRGTREI